MRVRRIKLFRAADEEDVELLTNLLDAAQFPVIELLSLYKLHCIVTHLRTSSMTPMALISSVLGMRMTSPVSCW